MDTISNYRQIRLVLDDCRSGTLGAVFARDVRAGRVGDRLIARDLWLPGLRVERIEQIGDVLLQAVTCYRDGSATLPR